MEAASAALKAKEDAIKADEARLASEKTTLEQEDARLKAEKTRLDQEAAADKARDDAAKVVADELKKQKEEADALAKATMADVAKLEQDKINLSTEKSAAEKLAADASKAKSDAEAEAAKAVKEKEDAAKLKADAIKEKEDAAKLKAEAIKEKEDAAKLKAEAEAKEIELKAEADRIAALDTAQKSEQARLVKEAEDAAKVTADAAVKKAEADAALSNANVARDTVLVEQGKIRDLEAKAKAEFAAQAATADVPDTPETPPMANALTDLQLAGDKVPDGAVDGDAVPGWMVYHEAGAPVVKDGKIHFVAKDSKWIANNLEKFSVVDGEKIRFLVSNLAVTKNVNFAIYEKNVYIGDLVNISPGVYEGIMTKASDEAAFWMYGKSLKPGVDSVSFSTVKLERVEPALGEE